MTFHRNNYGLILLAAGASSRLGTPKQLLPYGGTTLLQHMVQLAAEAFSPQVVVVLGANAGLLEPSLAGTAALVVRNALWEEGMASSIRCGLTALLGLNPGVEGAIFMVCDQPFVSPDLLNELITAHAQTGKGIIACRYGHTLGTPALFDKNFFPQLLQLEGPEGARKIIKQHPASVAAVAFALGAVDIDTPEDWERIGNRQ
jgi:molybdenum cofactor cytidylyltransferase